MFSYLLGAAPSPNVEPFNPTVLNGLERGAMPNFRFLGADLGTLLSPTTLSAYSIPTVIFFFAGVFFIINIVMAGFSMMTSKGQPAGFESAKTRLGNSIAGLLLVITAFWIVQAIGLILNLPGLNSTFGN